MIDLAAHGRLRLRPGADRHGLRRVRRRSVDAVRIRHHEARFVGGVWLQVEDAAGKHVGQDQVEDVRLGDALALQAHERHPVLPGCLARLAIRHRHRRIAVGIAFDQPFEAEVDERRGIDDELSGRDPGAGGRRRRRGLPKSADAHEEDDHATDGESRCAAHSLTRGASPLGLPDTLSHAPRRRRAPFAWLARALARDAGQLVCETTSNTASGESVRLRRARAPRSATACRRRGTRSLPPAIPRRRGSTASLDRAS